MKRHLFIYMILMIYLLLIVLFNILQPYSCFLLMNLLFYSLVKFHIIDYVCTY